MELAVATLHAEVSGVDINIPCKRYLRSHLQSDRLHSLQSKPSRAASEWHWMEEKARKTSWTRPTTSPAFMTNMERNSERSASGSLAILERKCMQMGKRTSQPSDRRVVVITAVSETSCE